MAILLENTQTQNINLPTGGFSLNCNLLYIFLFSGNFSMRYIVHNLTNFPLLISLNQVIFLDFAL